MVGSAESDDGESEIGMERDVGGAEGGKRVRVRAVSEVRERERV